MELPGVSLRLGAQSIAAFSLSNQSRNVPIFCKVEMSPFDPGGIGAECQRYPNTVIVDEGSAGKRREPVGRPEFPRARGRG